MPCHNSSYFLRQAIDSILNQIFEDFEFILIDDGSSDSTYSIISEYSDSRIRLLSNKYQKGNFVCRNIGMLKAIGKYVCVMDSDDISLPHRLQVQYEFMEKNKHIALIGSNVEKINSEGKSLAFTENMTSYSLLKVCLLKDSVCVHPSTFFRSNIIFSHGFIYNKNMKYAADYDFLVRCSQRFPIKNLSQVLLKYRLHSNQISIAKRKEQQAYADHVRLKQLTNFNVKLTQNERRQYLSLITNKGINPVEQPNYIKLLNKLLDANYASRYYCHSKLYLLFEALLANSYKL